MDYYGFVDAELAKQGLRLQAVTEAYMQRRLADVMAFVNGVVEEYSAAYRWEPETEAYFLNPMDRKWLFSFAFENPDRHLAFLNLTSAYGEDLHIHCAYGRQAYRRRGLARLNLIQQCQTGLDHGFTHMEGYWPKQNKGSILLYLRMGWEIEGMRDNQELLMRASLEAARDKAYGFYRAREGEHGG